MTEAVFRLPLTLELKPSRYLRHLVMVSGGAAALLLFLTQGLEAWVCVGGVAAGAVFFVSSVRRQRSPRRLTLLPDGVWIAPGSAQACALAASSVDLFGVLWLHGRTEDGRRHAVMVTPDAVSHPEGWRWLCIWFRNAPGARCMAPENPGA